jgi:hypothetical protein
MLNWYNEESLRVFERKVLRRILGPVCGNGFWHVRYNSELRGLFSEPDIVKTVKTGRLLWASTVVQMQRRWQMCTEL